MHEPCSANTVAVASQITRRAFWNDDFDADYLIRNKNRQYRWMFIAYPSSWNVYIACGVGERVHSFTHCIRTPYSVAIVLSLLRDTGITNFPRIFTHQFGDDDRKPPPGAFQSSRISRETDYNNVEQTACCMLFVVCVVVLWTSYLYETPLY